MVTAETEDDSTAFWSKEPPVSLSGVSRFRRWMFPALTATVVLILIIALGVSNMKMSNHLGYMEQRFSNLSNIIHSLNESQQHAVQGKELQRLQFAVENFKDQLTSVSEALKQLSHTDSLSRTVASLKCSLQHIINNSSAADGCCPLGWDQFGLNCFFFSSVSLSWNESRVWCDKQEAHLLILHEDKTWDFVIRRTVPKPFWVGLSDWRTGRWEWINQTPYRVELRRWTHSPPGKWIGYSRCAHLHTTGRLSDSGCSTKMQYICQKHSMHV